MAEKHPKSGSPKPLPRQKMREEETKCQASTSDREAPSQPVVIHPECPVCLQPSIHPVKVPCGHVFCFLCVKGAANQSQRCALCRQAIPPSFFDCPTLLNDIESTTASSSSSSSGITAERYAWFYEGRNGWWQYDERTNHEIEDGYRSKKRSFELLIAGFMYIIDLDNMSQMRRSDPSRRRRIKRDLITAPKKGIAGLKILKNEAEDEEEEAGGDENEPSRTNKGPPESQQNAARGSSWQASNQLEYQSTPESSDSLSPDISHDQLSQGLESLSLAIDQEESLQSRRQHQDDEDSEQVIEI